MIDSSNIRAHQHAAGAIGGQKRQALEQSIAPVIPSRKNRAQAREYDKDMYCLRHLVENAFLHLKRWRGIATRYAKNTASFLAAVHIRCIALWANIS